MRLLRRASLLLAAAAALSAPLPAQSPALARIDSLLDASRFTEARAALGRWQAEAAPGRAAGDVAYALILRARLAPAADSALPLYHEVALGHPASAWAPLALLRLGQAYAAAGQPDRAAAQLQRIARDYPASPLRPLALLWLARAQRAGRQVDAACATTRQALALPAADPDARRLLQLEQAACVAPPAAPATNRAAAPAAAPAGEGRFTIQLGAFRDRAAAFALAERLRAREFPTRVVHVGESGLVVVRAGHFRTAEAAAPMMRRVRPLVPSAIVAGDAHRERAASR